MISYLHVARLRFLAALTYRFEVVARILANAVLMTAAVFLWRTAFRGVSSASGVGERQMVTYAIVSALLGTTMAPGVQQRLHERIRRGDIAVDLIRPVQPLVFWLAEDLGLALSSLLLQLVPLLVLSVLVFDPLGPAGPVPAVLFLLSSVLTYAILWLLSALVGLVTFWTVELGNLGYIKDAVVRLLSGSIVPIWFFPGWFQGASKYLPFVYTYQLPLAIYIGRLRTAEALRGILVQGLWVAALGAVIVWTWLRGRRRVLVQGG